MNVFLTGGTGFVGRATLNRLLREKHAVTAAIRHENGDLVDGVDYRLFGDLGADCDFAGALKSQDVVVHAAARVHVMHDSASDPLAEFRRVNVEGTLKLARQASEAGVKRFIFISSIKVNGESTTEGEAFVADAQARPLDAYGISKMEAEKGLFELADETGLEVVVIRPVLVYGPGVKANFLSMMRWLYKGVPLPFGAIHNKRSLVSLDNLVDLIVTCLDHPSAPNQVFLVSDGEDLSTTELLRRMGAALGKRPLLIPVASRVLTLGATLLGKQALSQRLCGSLQVDISKTRKLLNWNPPVSVNEALRNTAEHFLGHHSK